MPENVTAAERPRLFISYSHTDKSIARRVARRLEAYSVSVWLDERKLQVGDTLSPLIRDHIAASVRRRGDCHFCGSEVRVGSQGSCASDRRDSSRGCVPASG